MQEEYRAAVETGLYHTILFNYDEWVAGGSLRMTEKEASSETYCAVYRGWMLKPEEYLRLFEELSDKGIRLLTTPREYDNLHLFPNVYPFIKKDTAGMIYFADGKVDVDAVKKKFRRFMVKDSVKSVKGTEFPGEYLKWDCNIAKKMALKEDLLKKVLVDGGIEDIQIRSLVVFTDNRIEVQNKYSGIRTCFVSQLAYIIDEYKDSTNMGEEEMEHIEGLIREAECKEAFPLEFDVAQYKKDFATLMVILEEASARAEEPEYEQEVIDEKISVWSVLKGVLTSRYAGYVGSAAATAKATFISTVAASLIRKGGVIR
jgi:hypothetical protein